MVSFHGDSRRARSTSVWIHWWSSVARANASMRSWVIGTQSVVPSGTPTKSAMAARSGMMVGVAMRQCVSARRFNPVSARSNVRVTLLLTSHPVPGTSGRMRARQRTRVPSPSLVRSTSAV